MSAKIYISELEITFTFKISILISFYLHSFFAASYQSFPRFDCSQQSNYHHQNNDIWKKNTNIL